MSVGMQVRFEIRTTIDGFPLTLNFADEDSLAEFCESAPPDCEVEIVMVHKVKANEVRRV